jgi:mono/diheme cytochrome c family protein
MQEIRHRVGRTYVRLLLASMGAVFLATAASTVVRAGQATEAASAPSVWDGVYTEEQAERGRVAFVANCAECHGIDLGGGEATALAGDTFWDDWRESTVDKLFDFASTNMPFDDLRLLAGTLSNSMYIDLVAYILSQNDLPAGDEELTPDSAVGVQIIAEDGPGELPNSTLAFVVGCLAESQDGGWQLTSGSRAVRAESAGDGTAQALTDRVYSLMFVLTPLDEYIGYKMAATGLLIGEGGIDGINVSTVDPVSETCD